ncbi:MAG: hypothetical protein M1824_000952 [Vezdaea acicularis]|nr:MAG: hypothetical protein M1824_000952 [Vezdaea acicularis]
MASKRSRATYEADLLSHPPQTAVTKVASEDRGDWDEVPVWKQEVLDEQGRKRLHGAFTGGFSAGYYNTVGSKEGWTPSTFISSKKNRQKKDKEATHQRPEDFMDEEDLQEAVEELENTDIYASLGSTEEELRRKALLKAVGEVDGDQKKEDGMLHMSAADATRAIAMARRNGQKGLGFGSKARPSASNGSPHTTSTEAVGNDPAVTRKPRKPISRGGFGVGILNDTGSDDENPYELQPKTSFRKVKSEKKKKKKITFGESPSPPPESTAGVSEKNSALEIKSPPEMIPAALTGSAQQTRPPSPPPPSSAKPPSITINPHIPNKELSPSPNPTTPKLKGPQKSVFAYLNSSARARIAAATGKTDLPIALNESAPPPSAPATLSLIPTLPPKTAEQALGRGLGGWLPYADAPAKRARYTAYLEHQAGLTDKPPERGRAVKQDEWVRELEEFKKAAEIFKPMAGMMAERFASASDSRPKASGADSKGLAGTADPSPLLSTPNEKLEDPAEAAARMGLFGPRTRSMQPFYPSRLLCKRFNVPPPTTVAPAPTPSEGVAGGGPSAAGTQKPQSRFTSGGFMTAQEPQGKAGELLGKGVMEELVKERGRVEAGGVAETEEVVKVKEEGEGVGPEEQARRDRQRKLEEWARGTSTGRGKKRTKKERPPMVQDKEDVTTSGNPVQADTPVLKAPEEVQEIPEEPQERPGDAVYRAVFGSDSEDDS